MDFSKKPSLAKIQELLTFLTPSQVKMLCIYFHGWAISFPKSPNHSNYRLNWIRRAMGEDVFLKLWTHYRGKRLYIPDDWDE